MRRTLVTLAVLLLLPTTGALAAAKKADPKPPKDSDSGKKGEWKAGTFSGLELRSIGPSGNSGRIVDVAVQAGKPSVYYVASASGGVWKTSNGGTTYSPIFDGQGSYSIGALALDPNDPLVVWVGTGENNSQRSVSYGDGVYKSVDGGKSWENVGLKSSEHIGKIVVDPRNSDVVYVAAQGPLWAAGGDRGLYKTLDGGKTWKQVLKISPDTGVTDLLLDPAHPDVLYAASYQRRRHVWTLLDGGPESAIYKSRDGGATWKKLTAGLPKEDMGRIGLALSPADPSTIYATIEAARKDGGFYRSQDGGANWEKRSSSVSSSPQYYQRVFADPKDVDRVYTVDLWVQVSEDGGKTFHNLGEKNKHSDNHVVWIEPTDTDHLLVGCDGGLYETHDRGASWAFKPNLPVTQFYRVSADNSKPFYFVYGGTQDNFSLGGPSRTTNDQGIVNSDWFVTQGGDGFQSQIDPEDPTIVYAESQYGGLARFDRKSGEAIDIQPQPPLGEALR
ncbi:MAG TPA: glycosyl hydrolase, partial [Thermoanaerobaculia bacterium]